MAPLSPLRMWSEGEKLWTTDDDCNLLKSLFILNTLLGIIGPICQLVVDDGALSQYAVDPPNLL